MLKILKSSIALLLLAALLPMQAQERQDSVRWMRADRPPSAILRGLQSLNNVDTTYIEPQRYNFTVMLQNTNTYEVYRLKTRDGLSITLAPEVTVRVGPYFGWRWIFFGYTVDVKHLNLKMDNSTRQEYGFSIYSSKIGVDLYHRKTGDNYKIRSLSLGNNVNTRPLRNAPFAGLTSKITGFNVYYIFNHRRFSYPAAFSQSTVQRRSAGSPLLGFGFTRQSLSIEWDKLTQMVEYVLGPEAMDGIDKSKLYGKVIYTDVSFSGGYAYNWVFAHNWLAAASLSLAVAYKRSVGENEHVKFNLREFSFNNFNLDGIARLGLVWNNTRWYAGASAILHGYSYHKDAFSTNNAFGSINIYFGYNFVKRKPKKKKWWQ